MSRGRAVRKLALALVAVLAFGGCDRLAGTGHVREAPDTIAFAVLPRQEAGDPEKLWRPFVDDMQAATGLKVKPYYAPSFEALSEAMRLQRIQAGLFSNSGALEAARHSGGEVFASAEAPPGQSFASVLIVRTNSPITVDQLLSCGRRFSFGMGEPQSTQGTLAPMAELFAPRGIDPYACFKLVRSANHSANAMSVASGMLDVATGDTVALANIERAHPEVARQVKVIWTSTPMPGNPVVWRKDLDPSVKEKLRAFFLGYGKAPGAQGERQRAFLAAIGVGGFKPADDDHLLPVREMEAVTALAAARRTHDAAAVHREDQELARVRKAEAKAAAPGT